MDDLISRSKLLNTIATEVRYDSENPLLSYAKLMQAIQDAPTEPQYLDLENTTIMGYRLRDLYLLSEALRESHIDKIDLIRFVNNVESAYNYATGEFTKSIKRSLEKSFEGLWDVDEEGKDAKTD